MNNEMFDTQFRINVDSSECVSLVAGGAFLDGKNIYDVWRFRNAAFESGKIYGLISEYGQGSMYLSYLIGGRVDFDDLILSCNNYRLSRKMLAEVSWNLEPSKEKYKSAVVKKSIEMALHKNRSGEDFDSVAQKFMLTEPRFDRKLVQLSGERWRASAALGYANRKKIFFAPYKTSKFYYCMCQSGLLKVLKELTDSGAVVLLPAGSDDIMKYIADECIYLDPEYDISGLKYF